MRGRADISKLARDVGEGCARQVVGTLGKPAAKPPTKAAGTAAAKPAAKNMPSPKRRR